MTDAERIEIVKFINDFAEYLKQKRLNKTTFEISIKSLKMFSEVA